MQTNFGKIVRDLKKKGYPDIADDIIDVVYAMSFSRNDFANRLNARLNGALKEYFKHLIGKYSNSQYTRKWKLEAETLVESIKYFYEDATLKGKQSSTVKKKVLLEIKNDFEKNKDRKFIVILDLMKTRYRVSKKALRGLNENDLALQGVKFLFGKF